MNILGDLPALLMAITLVGVPQGPAKTLIIVRDSQMKSLVLEVNKSWYKMSVLDEASETTLAILQVKATNTLARLAEDLLQAKLYGAPVQRKKIALEPSRFLGPCQIALVRRIRGQYEIRYLRDKESEEQFMVLLKKFLEACKAEMLPLCQRCAGQK